ncbi:MAG: HIT family protein [Erysipelotrichaceae bacterium]|nr:HIT family protein [Erysipelotrichaceae bacterium]
MCIFCEIINGNIPSSKVYEDEDTLAILDISQTTYGHTLVMPKKHYENFLEMPNEEYASLMAKAQKVAQMLQNKLNCNGMNLLINTNEVAGQTVMHTHIHLIPRYNQDDSIEIKFKENKFDLNEIINKLK